MAQSAPKITDEPANRLLDDLPDGWSIERTRETAGRTANDVHRELMLEHVTGAALLIKGSTLRGFTTYYCEPDAQFYETVIKSQVWGRRRIRSFEQCVDRGVLLASRFDSVYDA